MALSFAIETDEVVELNEYIEYVQKHVDLLDTESIAASAPKFRALMNNRKLITGVLNRELADWKTFQGGNTYTAQTFMLGSAPGFFIRVNIWAPPSTIPEVRAAEAQNFYYLVPHDHNFTFMTGGYLGAGYRTSIWEYDHANIAGIKGERVDLRFLERTSLPAGKIMMYRKSVDVHSQEHADEFSISLNLMVLPDETVTNRANQMIFDTANNTVKSVLSSSAGRVMLCDLAHHVGDGETAGLLDSLSTIHPDSRVRATCIRSLVKMHPDQAESIFERATKDPHPYVRHLGAQALEKGELNDSEFAKVAVDPHAAFESGPGTQDFAHYDNLTV